MERNIAAVKWMDRSKVARTGRNRGNERDRMPVAPFPDHAVSATLVHLSIVERRSITEEGDYGGRWERVEDGRYGAAGIADMAVHRAAPGRACRRRRGRSPRLEDLLFRRVRWRCLEDDRWRHLLGEHLGWLLPNRCRGRDRGLRV